MDVLTIKKSLTRNLIITCQLGSLYLGTIPTELPWLLKVYIVLARSEPTCHKDWCSMVKDFQTPNMLCKLCIKQVSACTLHRKLQKYGRPNTNFSQLYHTNFYHFLWSLLLVIHLLLGKFKNLTALVLIIILTPCDYYSVGNTER
jgi:hypothetical protein